MSAHKKVFKQAKKMRSINLSGNRIVGVLYWVVIVLFTLLEPWGNIDTRDFSYMGIQKFWEYNAYIAVVLISMAILGILFWKNKTELKTVIWAYVINTMFIVMNLFDLLHFFPDPAQPLPFLVSLIEIATSIIILGISIYLPKSTDKNNRNGPVH